VSGEVKKRRASSLVFLIAIALVAFAGNSVLCRMALKGEVIDASLFTALRVTSGALALVVFLVFRGQGGELLRKGSWRASACLLIYMGAFSWAYLRLETGVGALILFGAVQVTMVGWAAKSGERLSGWQWGGLLVALAGLAWLLLAPGTRAPSLMSGSLMALGGMAWGGYTLLGKGAVAPLEETMGNFMKAAPVAILIVVILWGETIWTGQGVLLAMASGVVTSATGYAVWYECLRYLSSTRAAVLQLLVPVLAAIGGLVFGAEPLTARLIFSSVLVLGGVGLVLKRNKGR